jgi:hypothetical protein
MAGGGIRILLDERLITFRHESGRILRREDYLKFAASGIQFEARVARHPSSDRSRQDQCGDRQD